MAADLAVGELLRALTYGGVDFVVIGGVAAVLHGSPRNTFDLDVIVARDPENLAALGVVLQRLDARLRGVEDVDFIADARSLRQAEILTLVTNAGALDVLAAPAGAPAYDALRERARVADVGGFEVRIASIADLIAMKRATGRPKDLDDIATLEAIERLRR